MAQVTVSLLMQAHHSMECMQSPATELCLPPSCNNELSQGLSCGCRLLATQPDQTAPVKNLHSHSILNSHSLEQRRAHRSEERGGEGTCPRMFASASLRPSTAPGAFPAAQWSGALSGPNRPQKQPGTTAWPIQTWPLPEPAQHVHMTR